MAHLYPQSHKHSHAHAHTYIHVYMYIRTHTHTHAHTRTHTHTHTYTCTYTHTCTLTHTHTHTHTHIHSRAHTHSILLGDGRESNGDLRELAAGLILSNPDKYSTAVLGKRNTQYVDWLLREQSWGGTSVIKVHTGEPVPRISCTKIFSHGNYSLTQVPVLYLTTVAQPCMQCSSASCIHVEQMYLIAGAIELSVFSEHYKVELDVVDVQTQRIDRFGTQIVSANSDLYIPCVRHSFCSVFMRWISIYDGTVAQLYCWATVITYF